MILLAARNVAAFIKNKISAVATLKTGTSTFTTTATGSNNFICYRPYQQPFLFADNKKFTSTMSSPKDSMERAKDGDTTNLLKRDHGESITNTNTAAAAATDDSNSNSSKGKGNTWKKAKKNKNKTNNRESKKHNTWMKNLDDDKKRDDPPHTGSFANPALREKFGVVLDDENKNKIKEDDANEKTAKRKVAVLVGFLGTKYGGFQVNPEQRTLQAELELALYRSGMISQSNFGTPQKYSWSNSARTDKGVHACAQVCSLKMELHEDEWTVNTDTEKESNNTTEVQERLQIPRLRLEKHLPDDIRVLDVIRTTRNFCAKTQRDRVRYQYMIPSFLLHADWISVMESQGIDTKKARQEHENPKHPLPTEQAKSLQQCLYDYRSTIESRNRLKTALRKYEGTHSFHNFTKGLKPGMATAKRYMESFQIQDPVIVNGMEWIPTQVLGQSFLLHQIRKMVCVAIDIARGAVSIDFMDRALSMTEEPIALHIAPAQGLFLEMSYFDGYNRRKNTQKSNNNDTLDLNWTVDGPANKRWSDFRDVVRSHIVEEEKNQLNFIQYMFLYVQFVFVCLNTFSFDARGFGSYKHKPHLFNAYIPSHFFFSLSLFAICLNNRHECTYGCRQVYDSVMKCNLKSE